MERSTRCRAALLLAAALFAACSGSGGGAADAGDAGGTDTGTGTDADAGNDSGLDAGSDTDTGDDAGCVPGAQADALTVVTVQGSVRGHGDEGTTAFQGIPFARPPTGDLRWKPPAPPGCIAGVLEAAGFGPACPQLDGDTGDYLGDEDCLTLNVWTPAALPASAADRPVLFFVHGGGNSLGSASETASGLPMYGGEALAAATGAVVVTAQYRIGPLGFLSHDGLAAESPQQASGNYGILDLVSALAWVRGNIAAFGGDPSRVLLFGESAGAQDTCMLLVSPLAKGLFGAALMESGGCPGTKKADALAVGLDLEGAAGCSAEPDPVACLRGRSPQELLEAMPPEVNVAGAQAPWQPHVDGWVLPDAPMDMLAAGEHNDVPFVVGVNADETARSIPQGVTEAQYQALVKATFGLLSAKVLAEYEVADYGSAWSAYYHLTTDLKFICPARQIAAAAAKGGSSPVFRYFFAETVDWALLEPFGAFHGVELMFVFDRLANALYDPPPEETGLMDAIQGYWSSLAADGVPSAAGQPSWPKYAPASDDALVLEGGNVHAQDGVRTAQCDFWANLLKWK
jgi:para-nitrobenzyl esterase